MEDSVGEDERREQGKPMAQAVKKDEQVVAGGGGGGEPDEEGGFLSAMASKIGAAMAGGNESSGEGGCTGNVSAASSGEEDEEKNEDDGRGGGGGGIFQKLMSSSHAPSPDSGASSSETGEVKAQDTGGEQGGILSSMASRIGMSRSGASSGNEDHSAVGDAKTSNGGDAVDHRNGEEENGDDANGGGILSAMATKIGMAMSSANGNGDRSTADDAKMSNGDAAVENVKGEEQVKGEEAGDGGILSAMASKIGMAMSGANGEENHGSGGMMPGRATATQKVAAVRLMRMGVKRMVADSLTRSCPTCHQTIRRQKPMRLRFSSPL